MWISPAPQSSVRWWLRTNTGGPPRWWAPGSSWRSRCRNGGCGRTGSRAKPVRDGECAVLLPAVPGARFDAVRHLEVAVDGGVLSASSEGSGDPVIVVQTALSVDELVPAIRLLRDRYRVITFDRRGYGGSAATPGPASIGSDASDCLAVMTKMDAVPAHVIGVSYSAAVALAVASAAPGAVRTLTVVEPPPRHVPDAAAFVDASRHLLLTYERAGGAAALEEVMTMLSGSDWRSRQEALMPGSVARIERDADAFFLRDIPALLRWEYGADDAARVSAPVLYVGGIDSGPWFRQTRAWVAALFPGMRCVMVDGAGHDLALTHPTHLATAISDFIATHSTP